MASRRRRAAMRRIRSVVSIMASPYRSTGAEVMSFCALEARRPNSDVGGMCRGVCRPGACRAQLLAVGIDVGRDLLVPHLRKGRVILAARPRGNRLGDQAGELRLEILRQCLQRYRREAADVPDHARLLLGAE